MKVLARKFKKKIKEKKENDTYENDVHHQATIISVFRLQR